MITITEVANRLKFVNGTSPSLSFPFEVKRNDDIVSVKSLAYGGGNISAPFDQWQKDDLSTFASSIELENYLIGFSGFRTASGGSEAVTYSCSATLLPSDILGIGSNPIILSQVFPVQIVDTQFYNIHSIILLKKNGTIAYNSEALQIYGCFVTNIPAGFIASPFPSYVICKESFDKTLLDGSSNYIQTKSVDFTEGNYNQLYLSTYSGDNPTGGNFEIEVRIEYSILQL